ncbi:hypothetical protein BDZ94DRAFT_1265925 [Collybia nuda]|uniref:Uncharacterized protein n=1 Tax=Collybia nuda TaxID=64659 RepID=A0A9P6CFQ2_9AGAR|nr:hypothetical protein BDZ94DRAFT_1265925 [Collybia nuda]
MLVKTSPLLTAAWSSPIIFECIVLASVMCNALSQPRTIKIHLTRVLHRDGIVFFLTLTLLRLLNFGLSFYPDLILLGILFVWPLISIFLNRSLFRIRRAKILDDELQREGPLLENIDASSRPSSPHTFQTKGRVTWAE